jgi:hypothetical protein
MVLIRSAFPNQPVTLRYFPTARRVLETLPTVAATERAFAGSSDARVTSVRQTSASSLRAYAERVRERTDTLLLGVPIMSLRPDSAS